MSSPSAPAEAPNQDLAGFGKPPVSSAPISVLLIGPSLDILGGQAVQATRLMSILSEVPGLRMSFFSINPRPPKPPKWVKSVPYLRTLVTFAMYASRLMFAVPRHD